MINFSEVEQSVRKLKKQLVDGELDQDTFETQLLDLVDVAPDGYYWMFGHETESWYRHNGQQWVKMDPDRLRALTEAQDGDAPQLQATSQNPQPADDQPQDADNSLSSAWRSINWAWFIASLIIIGLVGWIVYSASLA